MKRIVACFLCILLICAQASALAADVNVTSNTQDEKLRQQMALSGFQSTLSFAAEGDSFLSLDAATWAAVKLLTPKLTLSGTSTVVVHNKVAVGRESILSLLGGGEEWANIALLIDEAGTRYVKSPLLSDGDVFYAADKTFDLTTLLGDILSSGRWPSLLHVLYAVNTADEKWQTRFAAAATPYQAKIASWLQDYSITTTETDVTGGFITTITYQIPAAAILQETKQLLVDFFADATLVSLLREVMNAEEQAAYLQSAMLLPFLQMLDNVALAGEITVKRQYDYLGNAIYESIALPFASNSPIESLSYVRLPAEGGDSATFQCALRGQEGMAAPSLLFSVQAGEKGIYTGECTVTLPQADAAAGTYRFEYQLYMADPVDIADAFNSRWERDYEVTLLVRPDAALGIPPLSAVLNAKVYSKNSAITSVTYLDGTLTLSDTEGGGSITASLAGKTTRAWAPTMLSAAADAALRVDLMEQDARDALRTQLTARLVQKLSELGQRLAALLIPTQLSPTPGADG